MSELCIILFILINKLKIFHLLYFLYKKIAPVKNSIFRFIVYIILFIIVKKGLKKHLYKKWIGVEIGKYIPYCTLFHAITIYY